MDFSDFQLKSKSFFIFCDAHGPQKEKLTENPLCDGFEIFENDFHSIGVEISTKFSFKQILTELSSERYYGYASLLFFVKLQCDCNLQLFLLPLYEALAKNEQLKYVTKIVITAPYTKKGKPRESANDSLSVNDRYNYLTNQMAEIPDILNNTANALLKKMKPKNILVDNMIIIQSTRLINQNENPEIFEYILKELHQNAKSKSLQVMILDAIKDCFAAQFGFELVTFMTTSNAGFYLHNINPSLAIIFNHKTFRNSEFTVRTASDYDIEMLQNTFQRKKVPHLILKDGSAEEVGRIMNEVKLFDFTGFHSIYIFIMSHGDEGDIIHTKTESYNIEHDIVAPLLANKKLRNIQKSVFINACRGEFNSHFAVENELPPYQVKPISHAIIDDEYFAKVFSTQNGCVSFRFADGSPFIKEFCNVFAKPFDEVKLKEVVLEVKQKLEPLKKRGCIQVPEYNAKKASEQNIKMEFKNLTEIDMALQYWNQQTKLHFRKNTEF